MDQASIVTRFDRNW